MITRIFSAAAAVLCLLAMSCGGGNPPQNPEGAAAGDVQEDAVVRASEFADNAPAGEFTYGQVENEVFAGTGRSVMWDGQPFNEARSFVHMTAGGQCGTGNCGKEVFLVNANEEKAIRVVLTIPFQLAESAGYIAREYTLQPGEKQAAGCSHLCLGEDIVEFRRAIVIAEFTAAAVQ